MAFFKFRQKEPPAASPAPKKRRSRAERPADPPSDTIESLRRRARHRLIGAAVLVLAVVIGFPLLFDSQPRPIAVHAPIIIPDRDEVAALSLPEPTARQPAAPATDGATPEAPAAETAAPREEAVLPSRGQAEVVQPDESVLRAEQARQEQARREAEARTRAEAEAREKARREAAEREQARRQAEEAERKRRDAERREAERARAALEGRTPAPAASASAPAAQERFIVQIGAFADAGKVREVRQQAERAGLKTYIQDVQTSSGKVTRVRLGPFASRAEAEQAAARLKQLGLSGNILTL